MKRGINLQLFASPEDGNDNNQTEETAGAEIKVDPEVKTYTEEEIAQIKSDLEKEYTSKIEAARKEGLSEAERLAALTESERNAEKLKMLEAERDKYKTDLEIKALREETAKLLAEKKLDASFVDMVIGSDAETTKQNVAKVEAMFFSQVQIAVEERLKGETPKTGTGTGTFTATSSLKGALADKYNN